MTDMTDVSTIIHDIRIKEIRCTKENLCEPLNLEINRGFIDYALTKNKDRLIGITIDADTDEELTLVFNFCPFCGENFLKIFDDYINYKNVTPLDLERLKRE